MNIQIYLLIPKSNIISYAPLLSWFFWLLLGFFTLKKIMGYHNKYLHMMNGKEYKCQQKHQECMVLIIVLVDKFVNSHLMNRAINSY